MLIPSDQEDNKGRKKSRKKGSRVRFPVRAFPVARKASRTEERRQESKSSASKRILQIKLHKPEKMSSVRFPMKTVSLIQEVSTIQERHKEQNCLFR
jgi:hypothetical protein